MCGIEYVGLQLKRRLASKYFQPMAARQARQPRQDPPQEFLLRRRHGVHLGGYVTKTSEGISVVSKRQVLFFDTFVTLKVFSKIV